MTVKEKIEGLSKPLDIENVDFRVQSISEKGFCTILAYKDSRVDMERLDNVVGPLNWRREHTRDNKNCIVSIWDDEKKDWVSKEDTGTESNTEKEKGLASDSFKRACVNWGIGRDLYAYPRIFLQLKPNEFKTKQSGNKTIGTPTYDFVLNKWTWEVTYKDNKPERLIGKDENGVLRFDSNRAKNFAPSNTTQQPPAEKTQPQQPKKEEKKKPKMLKASFEAAMKSENVASLTKALSSYDLSPEQLKALSGRIAELKKLQTT